MGQLVTLAEEVLVAHGALVERQQAGVADELEAVLPAELAYRLGLPEHASLTDGAPRPGAPRLAYGSELLERLVGAATATVPLALATLCEPLKAGGDPAATALEKLTGLNCVLRRGDGTWEEGWAGYVIGDYRYVADADERREGLVRVAVNEESGAAVPALHGIEADPALAPGHDGLLAITDAETVLRRVGRAARWAAVRAVAGLGASVQRRHLRDRARLRAYYGGLASEMRAQHERLRARGARAEELGVREEKIAGLGPELERKLRDLAARYVLRVELRPVALLRVAVAVRRVRLRLQRRQAEGVLVVHQSAATRTVDPLACAACGSSMYAFAACDAQLHLLCAACEARRPSSRHCPVCR